MAQTRNGQSVVPGRILISFVLVLTFVGSLAVLWGLFENLGAADIFPAPPRVFGNTTTVNYDRPLQLSPSSEELLAALVVDGVSQTNRTVDFATYLVMGNTLRKQVLNLDNKPIVPDLYLDPKYGELQLTLSFRGDDGFVTKTSVRLGDLLDPAGARVHVSLPMSGPTFAYPSDYLVVGGSLALDLPAGPTNLHYQTPKLGALTIVTMLSRSLGGVAAYSMIGLPSRPSTDFHVRIYRSWVTFWFVMGLSLVPLAFALTVGHVWFRRPEDLLNFLGSVGLFVVTALPVRLVLVPTDVSGLTRVDFILGFELTILLWIGSIAYLGQEWPISRTDVKNFTQRIGRTLDRSATLTAVVVGVELCLCCCQPNPGPSPTPRPPTTSTPNAQYVSILAVTKEALKACQATLPPASDDSSCYGSSIFGLRLDQTVRLLVTVEPVVGFQPLGRQIYIAVSLPSIQSAEAQYNITAGLTISSYTLGQDFGVNPQNLPTSCKPLALVTPLRVPISCSQLPVTASQPSLLTYVPGTTLLKPGLDPALPLTDDNNSSLLLLQGGFSLYQTSVLVKKSRFVLDVVPTKPPT